MPFKAFYVDKSNNHKFCEGQGDVIDFSGRETFDEFLLKMCNHFKVSTRKKCARFGWTKSRLVHTFNGKSMHDFTTLHKFYKSRVNVYLVQYVDDDSDDEEAGDGEEQGGDGAEELDVDAPDDQEEPVHVDDDDTEPPAEPVAEPALEVVIPFSELEYQSIIAQGGCGSVHKGKWNGTDVAIKDCAATRLDDECAAMLKEEARLLRSLNHPNIITFYGIARKPFTVCIVTELMAFNLFDIVMGQEQDHKPSDDEKRRILVNVLHGVSFLHNKNIVHADLKPENILLSSDRQTVRLCDFGLSREKLTAGVTAATGGHVGTVMYFAPDILLDGTKSNFRTDIWAVGGVMTEVLTERFLWGSVRGDVKKALVGHMRKRVLPKAFTQSLAVSHRDVYDVIKGCFDYNPRGRPSARQLLEEFTLIA